MRAVLLASTALGLVVSSAPAQDRKGIRFWNLTLYTITTFQMSPAGKDNWGPDQCKNDRDGTVDHDERLRITGIEPGRYDVVRRQDRPRLRRAQRRGEGWCGLLNRGKATDGLPQVVSLLAAKPARGRANGRPPIFAHDLSCQPTASGAAALGIRLQAPPTPWRRGWRLHPSRPATGSRRVPDAAPSIETGRRPSERAERRTR